jgi:N-methylhydantoinase B
MTNTLNTPIEALEAYYPFRVNEYRLRARSGGRGRFHGGEGLVRELELLEPCDVTLLTDRRRVRPYGLAGGGAGSAGRNYRRRGGRLTSLPGKCNIRVRAGDAVRIETPGGGGWGSGRSPRAR